MANHYRILFAVFAKEHQPVQSFLDGLKSGGWGAHVAIPVSHEGKCGFQNDAATEPPACSSCEYHAWGAMLFPDMRILTSEGVSEINDCRYLSQFAYANPFDQADAVINESSCPGFTRPGSPDHIAVLLAESRGGVPHKWFEKVIEDNYPSGLRFFARCFDLGDIPYTDGEIERSAIFYSSDEAPHYVGLIEEPVPETTA